jgi:hypothetical protein
MQFDSMMVWTGSEVIPAKVSFWGCLDWISEISSWFGKDLNDVRGSETVFETWSGGVGGDVGEGKRGGVDDSEEDSILSWIYLGTISVVLDYQKELILVSKLDHFNLFLIQDYWK